MDRLLTARQVSELLEVKVSTVYDWVHQGLIPHIRLRRLLRFNKADIFRWVDQHTLQPKGVSRRKSPSSARELQKEFPL